MKVILKSDVPNLGRAGDILRVKSGYARNFLFPKKLALPALSKSLKEQAHKKKIAELQAQKAQIKRDEMSQKIQGHQICISKPSTPKGKLFGSVSAFEIVSCLEKDGFQIDKKFLQLKEPIKSAGKYQIQIDLGQETKPTITLIIQSEVVKDKSLSEPKKQT